VDPGYRPRVAIIVLNDVDIRIHNFWHAPSYLSSADLVYCRVEVVPDELLQDRGLHQEETLESFNAS